MTPTPCASACAPSDSTDSQSKTTPCSQSPGSSASSTSRTANASAAPSNAASPTARIGPFKPVADFDFNWPKRIDRPLIEELFSLAFVDDATNVVLVGPNGVGKTMLVKNLLHHGVLNGLTARFTTASDMLHELAAQDSDASLARRLRRFTGPQLLAIDEVGYLNYDNRYADLLFEVVTRRYLSLPVLITTNKPFSEWADVFSSAACVVTLVDRLVHRSEIVHLDGESYRLREAKEQAARRSKARSRRSAKSRASRGASS